MLVRSLVFLVSLVVSMAGFHAAGEATWFFAVLVSSCTAAIVCTVATRSGRVAGRQTMAGLTTGWRGHA